MTKIKTLCLLLVVCFFSCSSPSIDSGTGTVNPDEIINENSRCNIIFYANGGKMGNEYSKTFAYDKNQIITLPSAESLSLQRYGYKFIGWAQNAYVQEAEYSASANYTVLVNALFYAIWKAYSELSFLVSVDELSDITVDITENDTVITFAPIDNYDVYIWKIDGSEVYQTTWHNSYNCNKSSLSKGTHSIVLEAKKNEFWYSYSAQLTLNEDGTP